MATKQSNLKGRKSSNCGESLEPMLGYCSKIINELNKEDSAHLTEDLLAVLAVLKDFRPLFKVNKKSPVLVELLDWDGVSKSERANPSVREFSRNPSQHKS